MLIVPFALAAQSTSVPGKMPFDSIMTLVLQIDNNKEAERMLKQLISQGEVEAYAALAEVQSISRESQRGWIRTMEKGAKAGCRSCLDMLGSHYEAKEEYAKAAAYFERSGSGDAYWSLARMMVNGDYPESDTPDVHRAIELFHRSAALGCVDAHWALGELYRSPDFGVVDLDSSTYHHRLGAEGGDFQSMYALAVAYRDGIGCKPDTAAAISWFIRAAEAGHDKCHVLAADLLRDSRCCRNIDSAITLYRTAAQDISSCGKGNLRLAQCHMSGTGMPVDTAAAIELLQVATRCGDGEAADLMGRFYEKGLAGLPRNPDSAFFFYKLASDEDHPHGDYWIGAQLYDNGDYGNALGFIISAYSNGSSEAKLLLTLMLAVGIGLDQDTATARQMVDEVLATPDSLCNNGQAYVVLGLIDLVSEETVGAAESAAAHFRRAVECGNASAMMALGEMYAVGQGVERDTARAIELYEQAVAAGNVKAMTTLAATYMSGNIAPRNPRRAADLYQMAADLGSLDAKCALGRCYEEGEGVVLNSRRAYLLYREAAEAGSAWGMRLMGYCHVRGIYVEENAAEAAKWFERGSDAGDAGCQYLLGLMYANGEGVKKNKKRARKLLTAAAEAGVEDAAEALKEL